jgi:hypothetical protein
MKSLALLTFVLAAGVAACVAPATDRDSGDDTPVAMEKPFAAGGRIEMQLAGGAYEVRAASGDRIHVATSGHTGGTRVDVSTADASATVKVSETPRNNFHATIEVPKAADLVVHLTAGEMTVEPIAGSAEVESGAGNVTIEVVDANDYSSVDASVKAGDIDAGPFGESKSGLLQHLTWSGSGKRTLRASLGAGNLKLRSAK